MQLKSRFNEQYAETYPAQVFLDSQSAEVETSNLTRLQSLFWEYSSLLVTFVKLYFQGRILMAQNYVLACKLRMWDAVFLYMRVQIFLIRFSNGFPVGECWPRR
jgi:hypothetical protein